MMQHRIYKAVVARPYFSTRSGEQENGYEIVALSYTPFTSEKIADLEKQYGAISIEEGWEYA